MSGVAGMITDWELYDIPEESSLVSIPPDDMSLDDFVEFKNVPIIQKESWDKELHREAFSIARLQGQNMSTHPEALACSGKGVMQ